MVSSPNSTARLEADLKHLFDQSQSHNFDFKVKALQTIFQELIVETKAPHLVVYVNTINLFFQNHLTADDTHQLKAINNMLLVAFGSSTATPPPPSPSTSQPPAKETAQSIQSTPSSATKTEQATTKSSQYAVDDLFWNGALRFICQHNSELVRIAAAQLLGTLLVACVKPTKSKESKQVLSVVSPLLQDLVCDPNVTVSRKAAKAFSTISDHNLDQPIHFRHDFVVALLSLHGGQAGTRFASQQDRQCVYTILNSSHLPNITIYAMVVTFFEGCLAALALPQAKTSSSDRQQLSRFLCSIKSHHQHFDSVFQLSLRARQPRPISTS